jgi:hypothetical protein
MPKIEWDVHETEDGVFAIMPVEAREVAEEQWHSWMEIFGEMPDQPAPRMEGIENGLEKAVWLAVATEFADDHLCPHCGRDTTEYPWSRSKGDSTRARAAEEGS